MIIIEPTRVFVIRIGEKFSWLEKSLIHCSYHVEIAIREITGDKYRVNSLPLVLFKEEHSYFAIVHPFFFIFLFFYFFIFFFLPYDIYLFIQAINHLSFDRDRMQIEFQWLIELNLFVGDRKLSVFH